MNIIKGLALTFGTAAIMAVAVACGGEDPPSQLETPEAATVPAAQPSPIHDGQSSDSVASSAYALWTVRHADVDELIARSQVIVMGTLGEEFEERMISGYGPDGQITADPEGWLAYTDYTLNIEEIIRGDDVVSEGTDSVVFRMVGHVSAQDEAPTSVAFKLPEPGDHLLFAMGTNPDGTFGSGPEGLIDIESENAVYEDGIRFASGGTTAELLEQIKAQVSP
ncbi:MAG: hypothetical protein QF898_07065 [SAR202 cluster bacterium]|jgi:hypothetical protein|nr:hypothetical protein [SAR202 cluster bacterium]MDP6513598.1 hypothetical protein [SAR202 cluster bacterium]